MREFTTTIHPPLSLPPNLSFESKERSVAELYSRGVSRHIVVKSKFSRYKGTFHVKRKVSDQISPWISAGVYAAVEPVISRVEKVQRGRWSGEKEWPGKTMREGKKKREKDSSILKTCIDISWKTFYPACKRCSLSRIHFFRGLLVKQWKIYRSLRRRLRTKNLIEKLDRCIFKGSIIPSIWILTERSR